MSDKAVDRSRTMLTGSLHAQEEEFVKGEGNVSNYELLKEVVSVTQQ